MAVVAIPENCPLKGEHQYPLCDSATAMKAFGTMPNPSLTLAIDPAGEDLSDMIRGHSADCIFTEGIWQV